MKLSPERVAAFVGGELEIHNSAENYLYRGPITSIVLEGDELRFELKWMAINNGGPNKPTEMWTMSTDEAYPTSLTVLSISDAPGQLTVCSRHGERGILFPPRGNKLSPGRIRSLTV
jgi:hypothetical protein